MNRKGIDLKVAKGNAIEGTYVKREKPLELPSKLNITC